MSNEKLTPSKGWKITLKKDSKAQLLLKGTSFQVEDVPVVGDLKNAISFSVLKESGNYYVVASGGLLGGMQCFKKCCRCLVRPSTPSQESQSFINKSSLTTPNTAQEVSEIIPKELNANQLASELLKSVIKHHKAEAIELAVKLQKYPLLSDTNPYFTFNKLLKVAKQPLFFEWDCLLKLSVARLMRKFSALILVKQENHLEEVDEYIEELEGLLEFLEEDQPFSLECQFQLKYVINTLKTSKQGNNLPEIGQLMLKALGFGEAWELSESFFEELKLEKPFHRILKLENLFVKALSSEDLVNEMISAIQEKPNKEVEFEGIHLLFKLLPAIDLSTKKTTLKYLLSYLEDSCWQTRLKAVYEITVLKQNSSDSDYNSLLKVLNKRVGLEKKPEVLALIRNPSSVTSLEQLLCISSGTHNSEPTNVTKTLKHLKAEFNKAVPEDLETKLERIVNQTKQNYQQEFKHYVELKGGLCQNSTSPMDLTELAKGFLESPKRVLLVMGDPGSGKTLFAKKLSVELFGFSKYLPVYVYLPYIIKPGKNFQDGILQVNGLESNKQELETRPVVFICDAFDEVNLKVNFLKVKDTFQVYKKAKWVFLCRTYYASGVGLKTFSPFYAEKYFHNLRKDVYIQALTQKKIHKLLTSLKELPRDPQEYYDFIVRNQELLYLCRTPLVVNLVVQAYEKLKLLTTFNLYEVYRNFTLSFYEKGKCSLDRIDNFVSELAFEMTIKNKEFINKKDKNKTLYVSSFFEPEYKELKKGCLLRPNKKKDYIFLHKSIKEYYYCHKILPNQLLVSEDLSDFYSYKDTITECLNVYSIVKEKNILEFFKSMVVSNKNLQKILFEIVLDSTCENNYIASANAVTILNYSNYSFSGKDLAGVRIPYADLSESILDQTDLSYSDLTGVNFKNSVIKEVNFEGAEMNQVKLGEMPQLVSHYGAITSITATKVPNWLVSGSSDKEIRIWDIYKGVSVSKFKGHSLPITSVAVSKNCDLVVSGSEDCTVRLWDTQTGNCTKLKGHQKTVRCVALSKDSTHVVSASDDCTVRIWNLRNSECYVLEGHKKAVSGVCISGEFVISGSEDCSIRAWNIDSRKCVMKLKGHSVNCLSVSRNNQYIGSGSEKLVLIWSFKEGTCYKELRGHTSGVLSLQFGRNSEIVVSGSQNGTARVWSIESGECLQLIKGHNLPVRCVAVSEDMKYVFSGSIDCIIRTWDLEFHNSLKKRPGHSKSVSCLAVSDKLVASGSQDSDILVWSLDTAQCLKRLSGHQMAVLSLAFSKDSNLLVSSGGDGLVKVWSLSTGDCTFEIKDYCFQVSISPDSSLLLLASSSIKIFSLKEQTQIGELKTKAVALSMDNEWVVSGGKNDSLKVWDLNSGTCIKQLKGHTSTVSEVKISKDKSFIASGSFDKTIRLWYSQESFVLEGHSSSVCSIQLVEDLLVSGSEDKSIRLWDLESRSCVKVVWGHKHSVTALASFKNLLVSGSSDRTFRVWEVKKIVKKKRSLGKYLVEAENKDYSVRMKWSSGPMSMFSRANYCGNCENLSVHGKKVLETNMPVVAPILNYIFSSFLKHSVTK